MGMGYAGASANVFPTDKVKELCSAEYDALVAALRVDPRMDEEDDVSEYAADDLVAVAARVCLAWQGGENELTEDSRAAWAALRSKFEAETGLTLSVGYHDSADEGSRYDEVDGLFFAVGGMYELTEAGERWKDVVERKNFVEFC